MPLTLGSGEDTVTSIGSVALRSTTNDGGRQQRIGVFVE